MDIVRYYSDIETHFQSGRVLILSGPRRVGKTTLVNAYFQRFVGKKLLVSGDNLQIQHILSSQNFDTIFSFVNDLELLIIDEAQLIPNIGMGLKIIIDHYPDLKVIATGSSSFELAGQVGEPLVGRKWDLQLFPVSVLELRQQRTPLELHNLLPKLLVYGSYPDVLLSETDQMKRDVLMELRDSYLFKDIFAFQEVKSPKILLDILKLLAFQVGSEVSLSEIATQVGIDYKTVARYLDLFEKAYIIIPLRGYSRNLRKEVVSKAKYYFYDIGLRNALISSFNALEDRNDIGQLWENFLVSERIKKIHYHKLFTNTYFWRTWDQKEIDWIEERGGQLFGFEFKYKDSTAKHAAAFTQTYPGTQMAVVNRDTYLEFVT